MNASNWVVGALVMLGVVSTPVWGEATTAADKEQASIEKKEQKQQGKKARPARVTFLPYREMTSLTEEQKAQIVEIHRRYLDEKKKLDEAEKAEIQALLTPEQVEEARQVLEQRAAARKTQEAKPQKQAAVETEKTD